MKTKKLLLIGFAAVQAIISAEAQGTFQNLNFESPALPLVHLGGFFDFVAASNAVPAWTFYLGTNQQSAVLYNNVFGGTATIGLLGPGLTNALARIIEGNYTITLQAGVDPRVAFDPPFLDAAMTQSSLVPAAAQSIRFKFYTFSGSNGRFSVSLNGQTIGLVPLETTPTYTLMGGDIAGFAGSITELRIAANSTPAFLYSSFAFDAFVFSPEPVPEPGMFALIGLGALLFGWRRLRR